MKDEHELMFQKMEQSLNEYLFRQREENFEHATYSEEISSIQPVKDGDLKEVSFRGGRHRMLPFLYRRRDASVRILRAFGSLHPEN